MSNKLDFYIIKKSNLNFYGYKFRNNQFFSARFNNELYYNKFELMSNSLEIDIHEHKHTTLWFHGKSVTMIRITQPSESISFTGLVDIKETQ